MVKKLRFLTFLGIFASLVLVQCSWGLGILSPKKIQNLFLNPGESTVLQVTLRGEKGDGKIVAAEYVFSMNNNQIAWNDDSLATKFIDPNFFGVFLLDDGEEVTLNVPISAGINTKTGTYPRILVFTPEKGNIIGSTNFVQNAACTIYINVLGSPVRKHIIEAKFLPSQENKKILIFGTVANEGNFYFRIKDAIFSIETPNRVIEKAILNINKSKDGEIYVLPNELQKFDSVITVPLLSMKESYTVKISFFCKDLNGQSRELEFDEGEISAKFELPISPKMSNDIWGLLPYFDLDPSAEEEVVYVPSGGTAIKTWMLQNCSEEGLRVCVFSSEPGWDIKKEIKLPPEGIYELDMRLSNPDGKVKKLEGFLTFMAIGPDSQPVGKKVVKKVTQKIGDE